MTTGEADEATIQRARVARLYEVMGQLRVIADAAETGQIARAVRAAQSALWPVIEELGGDRAAFLQWRDEHEPPRRRDRR